MVIKHERLRDKDRAQPEEGAPLPFVPLSMEERLAIGEQSYRDLKDAILDNPETRAVYAQELRRLSTQPRRKATPSPWQRAVDTFQKTFLVFGSRPRTRKPRGRKPVR